MQMSVRLFVEKCSRAHNIRLSLSCQSQNSLRSDSVQLKVSLRSLSSFFVVQKEPKIPRLVVLLKRVHIMSFDI